MIRLIKLMLFRPKIEQCNTAGVRDPLARLG